MRSIFIVVTHFFKLTFNSVPRYLLFFVVPVLVFLGSIVLFGASQSRGLIVGVVNQDEGDFGNGLVEYLSQSQKNPIRKIASESVHSKILEGQLDFALIVPSEFSEEINQLQQPQVEMISIQGDIATSFFKPLINSYIQKTLFLRKHYASDRNVFLQRYTQWQSGALSLNVHEVDDARMNDEVVARSFGFFFFLIMVQASIITALMLLDKQEKTYFRIRLTSLSEISYALGNMIAAFIILMIQVILTMVIVVYILPIDLKLPLKWVMPLLGAYLFSAIGLGLLICSLVKNPVQANLIASLVLQPTFFLSGCFIPREVLPEVIQKISYIFPQSWAIMAIEKLQKGGQLGDVVMNIFIMLGFSALFVCLFALKMKNEQEQTA